MLVVIGGVLVLLSAFALIGGRVIVDRYAGTLHQETILGGAGRTDNPRLDGALNVLLVGIDQRPDSTEPIRSDSIIVAHVDAAHRQAYLVSIPRDLVVQIPAYPKSGWRGGKDKINAAFAYGSENNRGRRGGFELLGLTIRRLTGITFDAGAIVDFGGFQSVIKALGGVDMCVDERVESHHIGFDAAGRFVPPDKGGKPVVYLPGCRHLVPWQALDYVRQRYGLPNGDYDRQRHQQQFLKAVLQEARKQGVATNPVKLYRVMKAAGSALTVDTHGVPVQDWALTLGNVINGNVTMLKTNAGKVDPTVVHGESAEQLNPDSLAMLEAVRDDRLVPFVAAHPDFVSTDGTSG